MTLVIVVVVVVGFGALVALLTRRQHRDEVSSVMHYEKAMQKLGQMLGDEHQETARQRSRNTPPTTRKMQTSPPPHPPQQHLAGSVETRGQKASPRLSWLDSEIKLKSISNAESAESAEHSSGVKSPEDMRPMEQANRRHSADTAGELSGKEQDERLLRFGFPIGAGEDHEDVSKSSRSDDEQKQKMFRQPLVFESEDLRAEDDGGIGYTEKDVKEPTGGSESSIEGSFKESPVSSASSVIGRSLGWLGLGSMSENVSRSTRRGKHTKKARSSDFPNSSYDRSALLGYGQSDAANTSFVASPASPRTSGAAASPTYKGSFQPNEDDTYSTRPLSGYQVQYKGGSGWTIRWLRVGILATVVVLVAAGITAVMLSESHSSVTRSVSTNPATKATSRTVPKGSATSKSTSSQSKAESKRTSRSTSTSVPFVTTVGPVTSTFATYEIDTAAPYTLSFTATTRCWIGIYSNSAMTSLLWQGVLLSGESHTFSATGPVWVDLGAAYGVHVGANGVRISLPAHHLSPFRMAVEPR